MRYTAEITLALSRERVIALFDSQDNMKHWQPGLLAFEPITGTPGQVGAKSRLRYQMGKRTMEMIETITVRDLPERFVATYEAEGVFNISDNRFVVVGPDETKWVAENEFQLSGFMKIMGWIMPGMFKKQTLKYMHHFRDFAERGISVATVEC